MAITPVKRGLFIVFEGIDGSGTSTQANLLHEYLSRTNELSTQLTFEPTKGKVGTMIRQSLFEANPYQHASDGRGIDVSDRLFNDQLMHLIMADRHEHVFNTTDGIQQYLNAGITVICIRYMASTIAYQTNGSVTDIAKVVAAHREFPDPDMVIYLNNPVECSLDRLSTRSNLDCFERKEKLISVRANYERYFQTYCCSEHYCVNAAQPILSVHESVLAGLKAAKYIDDEGQIR